MTRGQYETARRFLEHAPRPRPRKPVELNPGAAKQPESVLHITEDCGRGLALVRGRNVRRVLELACVMDDARWSVSAKGYVVPAAALADIAAMADYAGAPYSIKRFGTEDTE